MRADVQMGSYRQLRVAGDSALRASPSPELTAVLEAHLDDPRIDPARLREFGATCDARRGGARRDHPIAR